jgi:hypothetical protein
MKIKGTQNLELEISVEEQKRICLEFLYENFNWQNNYFFGDDGKVYCPQTFYSSHSFNSDIFIREATDDDKILASLILKIKLLE